MHPKSSPFYRPLDTKDTAFIRLFYSELGYFQAHGNAQTKMPLHQFVGHLPNMINNLVGIPYKRKVSREKVSRFIDSHESFTMKCNNKENFMDIPCKRESFHALHFQFIQPRNFSRIYSMITYCIAIHWSGVNIH